MSLLILNWSRFTKNPSVDNISMLHLYSAALRRSLVYVIITLSNNDLFDFISFHQFGIHYPYSGKNLRNIPSLKIFLIALRTE